MQSLITMLTISQHYGQINTNIVIKIVKIITIFIC